MQRWCISGLLSMYNLCVHQATLWLSTIVAALTALTLFPHFNDSMHGIDISEVASNHGQPRHH